MKQHAPENPRGFRTHTHTIYLTQKIHAVFNDSMQWLHGNAQQTPQNLRLCQTESRIDTLSVTYRKTPSKAQVLSLWVLVGAWAKTVGPCNANVFTGVPYGIKGMETARIHNFPQALLIWK